VVARERRTGQGGGSILFRLLCEGQRKGLGLGKNRLRPKVGEQTSRKRRDWGIRFMETPVSCWCLGVVGLHNRVGGGSWTKKGGRGEKVIGNSYCCSAVTQERENKERGKGRETKEGGESGELVSPEFQGAKTTRE